ncbi:15086_t:CDS:1, partial [Acaulospora colombiana]
MGDNIKIRYDLVYSIYNKAEILRDQDTYKTAEEIFEFVIGKVPKDNALTKKEESYLLRVIQKSFDDESVRNKRGNKRQCRYCEEWTYAAHHCVHCIREYLRNNFQNWTSGNAEVDALIQECQNSTIRPSFVIEWIPYKNFSEVEYKKRGGCASIFKAVWRDGPYDKWNSEKQEIERKGLIE